MTGDATATFHVTRPNTTDDFEYRIESGPAASDWHTVRVVDPVELTGSSSTTITPPGYVNQPPRTITGISDIEVLQHSTVQFHLRFNRPAESAQIEWRPDGRSPLDAPDIIPVAIGSDPRSGEVGLRIRGGGDASRRAYQRERPAEVAKRGIAIDSRHRRCLAAL